MNHAGMDAALERTRRNVVLEALRPIAVAATAGLATGALVGGLGGRVAMLVLRLTSDPALHGVDTDDGFTIGIVSGATFFLVAFTAFLGVLAGLAYLLARTWLPVRSRPIVSAILAALVGGSQVIRPGGIDFTLLDPLWLAIVLFVLIPAAFGALLAKFVERWLGDPTAFDGLPSIVAGAVLPVLPFAFLGMRGLLLVTTIVLALAVRMRAPAVGRLFATRTAVWIARAGLAAVGLAAGAALVSDVADIL
jgi:hypothetical protein